MFEVYLGNWFMGSGITESAARATALREAYGAGLIGTDEHHLTATEFLASIEVNEVEESEK